MGALADQLGEVLVGGVLRSLVHEHVDHAALVVDLAHAHEVPGGGLGAAVGALLVVHGRAHERHLCFVDDADQRVEHHGRVGLTRGDAAVHLLDQALDHLGRLDHVLIGRTLDEHGGEPVEHGPVAGALEVGNAELHPPIQRRPQSQRPQRCGLALVGQAGDEQVPLIQAQRGCVAAQVLAPRGAALGVVGGDRLVGDQRGRADRLIERAGVGDPQPHRAGGLGDGDEHFVLVPGQVLGELAPLALHLVRGHPGREGDVDLYAASGDPDRTEHGSAGVAHLLDGVAQCRDAEVAQRLDHDGRRDGLALAVADVGGKRPRGCGLLLAADRPQREEGEERAQGDGRPPHHLNDGDQQVDELDHGRDRGDDVGDLLVRDGHDDAEGDQSADAHAGSHCNAFGGVEGRVEQVHAAAVAGVAEVLAPLLPLGCGFHVPRGFRRAHEPLVAGGGLAVPRPAGDDPRPAQHVQAVAGDGAAGRHRVLVRDRVLDGAAGPHPQRDGRSRGRVGHDGEHGRPGGSGVFVQVNNVLGHAEVSSAPHGRGR